MLVASGNWDQFKQDFGVVAHGLCQNTPEKYYSVQVKHPTDQTIPNVLAKLHPFFVAPGYQVPGAAAPTPPPGS